jgi:CBS domain-containing protein
MHAYVKDIMTTAVVSVPPGMPYRAMTAMLREHRVSGFPVVDDTGTVLGVVSEADLLAKEALEPAHGDHPDLLSRLSHRRRPKADGLTATDLMTRPAVTTGPDELVSGVARLMRAHRLKRLPVVDHDGHLVGIISRADVLSVFARPDEEIRREVTQDVIMDGFFTDPSRLEVTVQEGIVTLAGAPGSVVLGNNIVDQVRHVEGVVAVHDRFSYPQLPGRQEGQR